MAVGLKLIQELLERYGQLPVQTRQIVNTGVGGAAGAGLAELTGGDPLSGALMGGTIGLAGTGRDVPTQIQPRDPIIGPEMARWTGQRMDAPSVLTSRQKALTSMYDVATPWKDEINSLVERGVLENDDAIKIWQNNMGGGFGTVKAELAPIEESLTGLRDRGMLDMMRTRLGLAQEQHPWSVLQDRLKGLESEYYIALGRGDRTRAGALESEVNALRDQLAKRAVSYGGSTPAEIAGRRTAFESELPPDQLEAVQGGFNTIAEKVKSARRAMQQSGLIDEASLAKLEAREAAGDLYVPGWRQKGQEIDPATGALMRARSGVAERMLRGRQGTSVKSLEPLVQKLSGNEDLAYEDPLRNTLNFVAEGHKEAKRNIAAKAMIEAVAKDSDLVASGLFKSLRQGEALAPGMGKVAYFENGQVKEFAVPVEWADSLNFAHANDISRGLKTLSAFQRFNNRMVTTANVGFLLRNVPRDISDALLLTSKGSLPMPEEIVTFSKAWKQALVESLRDEMTPGREKFLRSGAGFSTLASSLRETPTWHTAIEPPRSGLTKFFQNLQDYQGAFEDATKRATFETQLAGGASELDAAYTARKLGGSPDFFQKGTLGTEAGIFFQFFNPQVQGIGRLVEQLKTNPAGFAVKMGALTAGLSALTAYNRGFTNPDSGRPEIEHIPEQIRLQNIIIMDPTGSSVDENGRRHHDYYRIPLGHVARALLAPMIGILQNVQGEALAPNAAQIASNTAAGFLPTSGPVDMDKPIESAMSQMGSGVNPLLRAPLEQAANRSFFNQVPIVGKRVERLQPKYQFTEDTQPVAIWLAQKVFPWMPFLNSPDRMEHLLRTFLPGPGEQAMGPLNASIEDYTEDPSRIPVVGPIARSFFTSKQDAFRQKGAEDFYGGMNEAAQAVATRNRLKAEGRLEELAEFETDPRNMELVQANPQFARTARALSDIARERERIRREVPPGPERDQALNALWRTQMQILQGTQNPLMVQ